MNKYGAEARDWWQKNAATRYAALENPQEFFTELGEQIAHQVHDLSQSLAGSDEQSEDYLEKVNRLTAATRQAEEVVKADLMWVEPETSGAELRQEWEATRPRDESILDWAMQFTDGEGPLEEIPEKAAYWLMPEEFFTELTTSETPWKVMEAHEAALTQAANLRFARWVKHGSQSGQE